QHDRDRDGEDRNDRARDVPEEDEDDEADDQQLFPERVLQRVNRAIDQLRTVVGRNDLDPFREGLLHVLQLRLHAVDHVQRILAVPHDHDPTDRLALAVELDEAAPQIRAEVDLADVTDEDRRAVAVRPDGDLLDVVDGGDVAAAAHHVLGAVELHEPPADLVVRAPDGLHDLAEWEMVGKEGRGVDLDLILLDEASDRRHL